MPVAYSSRGIKDPTSDLLRNTSTYFGNISNNCSNSSTRAISIGYIQGFKDINKKDENFKRLQEIGGFEDNWNSYGAKSFSEILILKCLNIVNEIVKQPDIFPTGRQSIQFEYEKRNGEYLEFEIFEDHIDMLYIDEADNEEEDTLSFDIDKINEVVKRFHG